MISTDRVITGRELAAYIPIRSRDSYDFTLPTIGQLYDYLFTGEGIYVRALRPGLSVLLRIHDCELRGLAPLGEVFPPPIGDPVDFQFPRVPAAYLQKMLERSIEACVENESPIEALFHLLWNEEAGRWQLNKPAQDATPPSVRPIDDGAGSSYAEALIELHSHHGMTAFFSSADDADEQGFRIYAVIGEIFTEPKIRVRVGCFGHFQEIPAETIFELPQTITDNHEEEPFVEIDEKN